jgi:hypothetical protein
MISSSRVFSKGSIRPAVAEIVPDRALMMRSKPFLLRFISPHDPAVQGFIKLACPQGFSVYPIVLRNKKRSLFLSTQSFTAVTWATFAVKQVNQKALVVSTMA